MKGSLTVARRELRSSFDQPTAYVLAVAFLGVSLFFAFRDMYATQTASLRSIFGLLPWIFAFLVPAVTMRAVAEERRGRTMEWLLAQPVSEADILIGKFLGNWAFVLVALAGTLPTAIGVLLVSDADPGIMVAQYVGAAFLAAQFVALGLLASALTRNQIVAWIVAATIAFVLILVGQPVVQIGLPTLISGWLERLSVISHFDNVARGVIDLRDLVYFATTSAFFLVLAIGMVSRDRLSPSRAEARRLRLGVWVVTGLVLTVNLLGSHIRGRIDLTAESLYTLSDGTRQVLGDLEDIVQIKLYASDELPPEIQIQLRDVRDLLSDMRSAAGGNLVVSEIDPEGDEEAEAEAAGYGVYPVQFNVLRDDEYVERRGYYGLVALYADDSEILQVVRRTDDLEFRLVSSIDRMTGTDRGEVAFASGFGMKGAAEVPLLSTGLGDRYEITSIEIAGDSAPPIELGEGDVLVLGGPTQPLDSLAVERVRAFMDAGGSALIFVEPILLNPQNPTQAIPVFSGIEGLLADRGVRTTGQLVADLASHSNVDTGRRSFFGPVVSPYPLWPIAMRGSDHATVSELERLSLRWATALEAEDSARITPLWVTSEAAGLKGPMEPLAPRQDWTRPREELETHMVGLAVLPLEGESEGRLVVVGDATFVEEADVQANPTNLIFLANAIDWLAQDDVLINIRSKNREPAPLVFEDDDATKELLKWGNLAGMPLLFIAIGAIRITGRRKRAMARWEEEKK